jgi:hypothetical protein
VGSNRGFHVQSAIIRGVELWHRPTTAPREEV